MASIPYSDSVDNTSLKTNVQNSGVITEPGCTHRQILKSSALVGGASVLNIVIGIVRTKVMAILLGPGGVGLFGIYNSIANITQTLAGMGVNSSGVRQIADAVSSDEEARVAQTTVVLQFVSIVLGALGSIFLIALAGPISTITFGSQVHKSEITLLAIVVFLMLVSGGQSALVQGKRRIADLAKMNVLGALSATVFSIPFVYMLGEKGIVPALVAVAAMTLLSSWWFSRKIRIERINVNIWNMWREASALLKLGLALMSSGLMTMGVAYVIRLTILRKLGFQATGLYQSAWTLGGLYVGFILQAMGADFYPRLTAVAHDNEECNRLVNEQTEIGILMAGPGVLATLTFARLVLTLLYSAKFIDAVPILRWLSIGTVLQVITWPIGFVVIAKAKQKIFFLCEAAWTIVSLALAWICVSAFGLVGAGIAFFGSYVFHGIMIYIVVHRLTGFEWTRGNKQMISLYMVSIAVVFCAFSFLSFATALCIGVIAVIISSVYSVRTFINVVSIGKMRMFLHRIRLRTSSVLLNGPN